MNAYFLILRVKFLQGSKWDYEQEDLDDVQCEFNNYLKKGADHVRMTYLKQFQILKTELKDLE